MFSPFTDTAYLKVEATEFLYHFIFRLKARVLYYANNWIYTTNHKRIAVNYFWFVILSGIVGMVLATAIRLEFAYPGVGIFVGDSLQYLTIASAHGVIMVFFMIMPLLFGAFGNFLLPTQLGVHDVAFPRLNSAAFWFLPAGLIMLAQMICVDRRFQRMNCFNVREFQALLKQRFFADLITDLAFHNELDLMASSLRSKGITGSIMSPSSLTFSQSPLTLTAIATDFNSLIIDSTKLDKLYYDPSIQPTLTGPSSFRYLSAVLGLLTEVITLDQAWPDRPRPIRWVVRLITGACRWVGHKIYTVIRFPIDLIRSIYRVLRPFTANAWRNQRAFFWETLEYIDMNFPVYSVRLPLFESILFFILIPLRVLRDYWRQIDQLFEEFTIWALALYCPLVTVKDWGHFYFEIIRVWAWVLNQYLTGSFEFVHLMLTGRFSSKERRDVFIRYTWGPIEPLYNFGWALWQGNFKSGSAALLHEVEVAAAAVIYWLSCTYGMRSYWKPHIELIWGWYEGLMRIRDGVLRLFKVPSVDIVIEWVVDLMASPIISLFYNLQYVSQVMWRHRPFKEGIHFRLRFWRRPGVKTPVIVEIEDAGTSWTWTFESRLWHRLQVDTHMICPYDYKAGNYLTSASRNLFKVLIPSINAIAGGLRPAHWSLSPNTPARLTDLIDVASSPMTSMQHSTLVVTPIFTADDMLTYSQMTKLDFSRLASSYTELFLGSSLQARIYMNWRELRFTREAWRCKALIGRHQRTLYHRYVDESTLFWSIERNARDLLPGWAMITPFSSRTRFTAVGKVDIGLMGVLLVLNSSIISGANFILTYRYLSTLNNRKMRDARSFFAEGVIVASWMMIAANPMLVIGIIMLLSDRHWQTSFFDYSGGGDTILFQHMFWFFGHPEVYVIMIPVFGFTNTFLSYYLKKRVSARASLMYSMYTIAFLGFFVWGHHMYMVGLSHTTRMLFSTLTVMISVPAATKLMHWCVTIVNSTFVFELPLAFTLTFIFFFVSGGVSGMCVAHTGMDILFHDTFYVIGHFHVMLAGAAMFGSFGAFYFYFPAIFGVRYSRLYSYLHFTYYLIGQLMTVAPMFWLGYAGMPRRVLDYPTSFGGWHSLVSGGHLITVGGMLSFFIMIFDSLRKSRTHVRNTFGVNRFNTRLNFYIFNVARLHSIKQKMFFFSRDRAKSTLRRRVRIETFETTLVTYALVSRTKQ